MPEILPLPAAPHANHQLFSDHYLNRTLPERLDWAELLDTAAPVRETLAALFAGFTPRDNEAQTEDGWINIPVKERDDWQEWFEAQKQAHAGRTSAIVAREADLNARAYALFNLEAAEIALIEAATKYQYGEV